MEVIPAQEAVLAHGRLHLDHFQAESEIYRLICPAVRVTVRSQQIRALNLAWALNRKLRHGPSVAVIGGGAAGLTFAACAARLGAAVQLYESARLMHLQRGSWHRPLHPEIYTWPDHTAFRPVSHLPLLGWTTGSANDVATEIVGKFWAVQQQVGDDRLTVHELTRATLCANGEVALKSLNASDGKVQQRLRFDIIVVAVGFGVEDRLVDSHPGSYWRGDALDQPFLDDAVPTVVISGAGDGAHIDLLRTCCPDTDQGAFLDFVLGSTLRDPELLRRVAQFDRPDLDARGRGSKVHEGYAALRPRVCRSLRDVDSALMSRRRPVIVHWLFRGADPFDHASLPINRFLVSRLIKHSPRYGLQLHPQSELCRVSGIANGMQRVEFVEDGEAATPLECHQVLCRWGPKAHKTHARLLSSAAACFETREDDASALAAVFGTRDEHKDCHRPCGWPDDRRFLARLSLKPVKPRLRAEVLCAFDSPTDEHPLAPWVYRLHIWLEGVCEGVRATYALHPEEGNRPVVRVGIGPRHDQWLNTRNDYSIRLHTSDGYEWRAGTVLEAVRRCYGSMAKPRRVSHGVSIMRRGDDGAFVAAGSQPVTKALWLLEAQTATMKVARLPK